jgi:hypothetical protein
MFKFLLVVTLALAVVVSASNDHGYNSKGLKIRAEVLETFHSFGRDLDTFLNDDGSDAVRAQAVLDQAFSYMSASVSAKVQGAGPFTFSQFKSTFAAAAPVWQFSRHIYQNPVFEFDSNDDEINLSVYYNVYSIQNGVSKFGIGQIFTTWREEGHGQDHTYKMTYYETKGDAWTPAN